MLTPLEKQIAAGLGHIESWWTLDAKIRASELHVQHITTVGDEITVTLRPYPPTVPSEPSRAIKL